jgi:lysophospholipase L1-like esterase
MSGERDAVGTSTDAYGNRQVDAFYTRDSSANPIGLADTNGPLLPSVNRLTQFQLKKWRAALANMLNGAANAKIAFVGDSTTAGFFASGSQYANNRPLTVANRIAALLNGRGITATVGNTFGSSLNIGTIATFATYDTRWSFGAGWVCNSLTGIVGQEALTHSSANTNSADFTPVAAFDTIDMWTVTNPAYQDFTIAVDGGGALATVDASQALSILKTTVTTTDATHTINIAKTAANAALTHILGIDTYRSAAKSVQCWQMGMGGATSAIWGTTTSSVWLAPNLLATYAPDLTVICVGINDWIAGVTSATFQTNMQVLITKALSTGSVILVTPPPTQIGYSSATQLNMDVIRAAIFTLAQTNNVPVLDIFGRFVSYTDANTYGMYGDGAHPDKTGYQDWANALIGYIAP